MHHHHTYKLLVFDLDGTLIDSKDDLVASVNATLRHFHKPVLPADVVASYVGDGAATLVRRALGLPEVHAHGAGSALFSEALKYFLDYYRAHKLDHTHLYPGVAEVLAALARHHALAVLTNKPVRPSRDILKALGIGEWFASVYGGDSFASKKPNPEGLNYLIHEQAARPATTLMIGDSAVDVQTGRNASVRVCAVSYGFGAHTLGLHPADWQIDSLAELRRITGRA